MFKELFVYFAVFTVGILGAGTVFVLLDFKTSPAEEDDRDIPYENYYLLGNTKEDIIKYEKQKNINKGVVKEKTPEGTVYLKYNNDDVRFDYWADKSISYKHLEVLARKYVIIFECKENYINIFKELLKATEKNKNKTETEPKQDNVFAKLKNYKTDKDDDREFIVNEKANVYKKIGTCKDFKELDKEPKHRNIDYKTFINKSA